MEALELIKSGYQTEADTFARYFVADVRVSLSPEAIYEMLGQQSLDIRGEIAKYLGEELVDLIMAARRQMQ